MPRKLAYKQLSSLLVGKQQLGEDVPVLSGQVWGVWGSDRLETGRRARFHSCPVLPRDQGPVDGLRQSVGSEASELVTHCPGGRPGEGGIKVGRLWNFHLLRLRLCSRRTCVCPLRYCILGEQ